MAQASTSQTPPAPVPATAAPEMETIVTCTPTVVQTPLTVLVVGAGGNGARIIPPLTQMLRRQDRLFIMDHDIVEDRNLVRQHFTERDIGQPKALILAQRYRKRDLRPTALVQRLTAENLGPTIQGLEWSHGPGHLVIVGCVDNNDARGIINRVITGPGIGSIQSTAYIDVGNERRGGQVLMSLKTWPMAVRVLGQDLTQSRYYSMSTLHDAMPQLCKPTPWNCDECAVSNAPSATTCSKCGRAQGSCGNRLDLQTVMVNHMAAGMVLNCLSWLMLGIPFTSAGAFFSTLNTVQPIKIKSVNHSRYTLGVDTSFADGAIS